MSNEIDIGQLTEVLNYKADIDLTNTTTNLSSASGKYYAGIGMPSLNYIDLTLGASGTEYIAPANGYFLFIKEAGETGKFLSLVRNDAFSVEGHPNLAGNWGRIILPVRKNDVIQVGYSATGETKYFRFYYAEGELV